MKMKSLPEGAVSAGQISVSPGLQEYKTKKRFNWLFSTSQLQNIKNICLLLLFFFSKCRTTPKTQYTGCSVHENNNGQAAFENPMYNTNAKAVEGKAVRFDPNLNTVCTMV